MLERVPFAFHSVTESLEKNLAQTKEIKIVKFNYRVDVIYGALFYQKFRANVTTPWEAVTDATLLAFTPSQLGDIKKALQK